MSTLFEAGDAIHGALRQMETIMSNAAPDDLPETRRTGEA